MDQIKPNLFIVGAGKAGTFAMYHYLNQHPEVFMSPVKEPNYFGSDLLYRQRQSHWTNISPCSMEPKERRQ